MLADDLLYFDIEQTVRDYEYTKRSMKGFNQVIDSDEFMDMDANAIFEYLGSRMEIVNFCDYLKRYIYEKAEMDQPFTEVDDLVYQEIILDSMRETHTPISFQTTSKKPRAAVKGWLKQKAAQRSTIFILGFGLRMSAEDVSEFLTKVLREADFNFNTVEETVYWYFIKQGMSYQKAKAFLEKMSSDEPSSLKKKNWETMNQSPEMFLLDENNLEEYVRYIKNQGIDEAMQKKTQDVFIDLYQQCRELIAQQFMLSAQEDQEVCGKASDKIWEAGDIRPSHVEEVICAGIPVDKHGNLKKSSISLLAAHFGQKRMSRQRIEGILNGTISVGRFDIITLLFYIFTQKEEYEYCPEDRFRAYLDLTNKKLSECNMMGVYPANPYETFVLLCLNTDDPLEAYTQVLEIAYKVDFFA